MDSTGDAEVEELKRALDQTGVKLLLACAAGTTREMMWIAGVVATASETWVSSGSARYGKT